MSVTIICQRQRDRQQCSKTIIGWPCCWRTVSACSRLLLFSGWFQWQLKSKAAAVANGQIQLLYCKHDLSQQLSIHAVDWLRLQETHQRVKTTIIPIFCAQINPICPFKVYLWALIGIHFCDSASKKVGWVKQFNQRRCGLNLECMKAVFLKKFEFVPASFMFVFKSCGVFSVENLFHLAYVCQQWVVCGFICWFWAVTWTSHWLTYWQGYVLLLWMLSHLKTIQRWEEWFRIWIEHEQLAIWFYLVSN